mmetsp:Transcript_21903/g.62850  ORF Transcript_21903/g.62850 Transcript_21903/m.62850 type:complete len:110 (-) Transcript_21903:458-787(-)
MSHKTKTNIRDSATFILSHLKSSTTPNPSAVTAATTKATKIPAPAIMATSSSVESLSPVSLLCICDAADESAELSEKVHSSSIANGDTSLLRKPSGPFVLSVFDSPFEF